MNIGGQNLSIFQLAILIVAIAGVVALVALALNTMGISLPYWVIQAFWILVIVFGIIFCIQLIRGMMGGPGPGQPG